ncbi:MAG TPA: glycosyltransferase family 4 protein [Candidatus Paceibacterota bacterium]|nr:glycosyltransferase family 4 protein [Candidatus Paceibacterota bacterium]
MMFLYILLLILSFLGVLIYRRIAIRSNIIDIPNERSSHTVPTPRGAGVAVSAIWFITIIYLFLIEKKIPSNLFYALSGGLLLSLIGIIDDIWSISPKVRLIVQIIASSIALFALGGLPKIDLGFYCIESFWLLTPIAFVMIIWFINLFNFLDGIDGYLGVETLFIFGFVGFFFSDNTAICLALIIVGFLFHNWPKAKVFMGDVGSTLIGYNVAVFALYYQNSGKTSLIIWLILSSLFWFDATLTLYRRFRNKENLMKAHKKHAYQRIVQAGYSHQKTLFYSIGINIIILGLVIMAIIYMKFSFFLLVLNVLLLYCIDRLIGINKPFPAE